MVETPWGASESLRSRMLSPGPGTPAEDVARNQRQRLYGAMVASVASRGYAATRVTDLIELSGVSRRSFYGLFPDKEACFKAVVEELVVEAVARVDPGEVEGEERARRRFEALARTVMEQPAASRLCMLEAFAAGPEALRPLEDALTAVEKLMQIRAAEMPDRAGTPPEMISALVGAAIEIVRTRLRRNTQAELIDLAGPLMDFLLSYRPPPQPLRLATRPPAAGPETLAGHDHAERALRAFAVVVAERGYMNATIDQVVKRASMSPTTFYAHFDGKTDALMAAIDSAGAQLGAVVLPAFRRSHDWPAAVRAAFGGIFNFMASRPALAHLVFVDVYAAGGEALARRDEALRLLTNLVEEGRQRSPEVPAIAVEAVIGAIYSIAYKQVREDGAASLPTLAPLCAYLTLAPYIGAESACEAANADGRQRTFPEGIGEADWERTKILTLLQRVHAQQRHERAATLEEISRELEMPGETVEAHLEELVSAELVEPVAEGGPDGEGESAYRLHLPLIDDADWARLDQPQREKISRHIGYLVLADVTRAVQAGTFDRRPTRYLSRVIGRVDEQGWRELHDIHDASLSAALAAKARSDVRLEGAEEEGIPFRAIQAVFEMPPENGGETA
jgi:AcrR family transcriptional regulator